MSEENKIVKLTDKQLEKVDAGYGGESPCDGWHCDDWQEDDKRPVAIGYGACHSCGFCSHMIRPEGPCSLGHPWFVVQ